MHKVEKARKEILAQKLLPLYYHEDPVLSLSILKALYEAGIRVVEYTNRGEAAVGNFKVLREAVDKEMPGLLLGIGTIKSKSQAVQYIDAGTDFIICPSTNEEVGSTVQEAGLLWIPGCMTPTEIATAENAGATLVKIFPGNLLGPSYISSIRDIFPGVQFLVTGGVEAEEENLRSWFKAGVAGVGMGSKLISKERISQGDFEGLRAAAADAMAKIKAVG